MRREREYKDVRLNIAIKELSSYRQKKYLLSKLKEKRTELEDKYSELKGIAYDGIHVQGGNRQDCVADNAIEYADLCLKIARIELEIEYALLSIEEKIKNLNTIQWRVLDMYYIQGYSLMKVAQNMNYSFEGIKDIKHAAIKNFANLEVHT